MKRSCEYCPYRSYLFENVFGEALERLDKVKKVEIVSKGKILVRQGEQIRDFIYLKTGLLKVYRSCKDCKDQIVSLAGPLDFVGMLGIFSSPVYLYSIAALEDSDICRIPMDLLKELMSKNNSLSRSLLTKMSELSDNILADKLSINRRNLRGRTAYILLMLANDVYKGSSFDIPVTRKEMGQLIDMRTENVIRILSEFKSDGIIELEGKRVNILEMGKLEKISSYG